MPTLYLHIGMPKTGSTTIQHFCEENNDAFARRGYYYPPAVRFEGVYANHNASFLMYSPRDAAGVPNGRELNEKWERCFERIAGELRAHPNLILSEEMLWTHGKLDAIGHLSEVAKQSGFELRVIVYLRRQDMFLSSMWAQDVKGNSNERAVWKWEEMLARADECVPLDYYRRLEEFAAIVGRDHMIVRIYDRKSFPEGNVALDFLEALGLEMAEDFALLEKDRNLSIGGNALEIKRIINGLPGQSYALKQKAWKASVDCYQSEKKEMLCSAFSAEEQRSILEKCAESNRRIARDYFGDANAPLFDAPEPLPPKWEVDNPLMYESIIRFFWLTIMQQQQEIEELKSKFYLRRKLRTLWRKLRSKFAARLGRKA